MKCQWLTFEDINYPFWYGNKCIPEIFGQLKNLKADKFIIVTDDNVWNLYGYMMYDDINRIAKTLVLKSPHGEKMKSLEILNSYLESAINWGVSRQSVIITLGGGVPENVGGLLAALLFRGIRLVHMPTNLIGMFDSVISLKQAINSSKGKNLIGTYHIPTMVLADTNFLLTLSQREIRSGMCEMIKNSLAIQPDTIDFLKENLSLSCISNPEIMNILLEQSISAKLRVMKNDKFEKSQGLVLEYGHTLGHAIELADHQISSSGGISHGEAVGIGMLGAAHIAYELGYLDDTSVELHYELLKLIDAPQKIPEAISCKDVLQKCMFDNKRGYIVSLGDTVNMILLKKIGEVAEGLSMPLIPVQISVISNILKNLV
jgi:3-dehydroquinate synthetase